ncbi:hypothetical protein Sjap_005861 [Stephania japonica]|uniref:Uncharacterized protein n=1 Tax=Stephania japonica TaxID=461633 RepID=A0AAP0PID5_9MAGN
MGTTIYYNKYILRFTVTRNQSPHLAHRGPPTLKRGQQPQVRDNNLDKGTS